MTVKHVITSRKRKMKAIVRIIQGNPMWSISFVIIMGSTTPPSDEPEAMIPKAAARRLKNHVTREDMQQLKTALEPIEPTMACDRKI